MSPSSPNQRIDNAIEAAVALSRLAHNPVVRRNFAPGHEGEIEFEIAREAHDARLEQARVLAYETARRTVIPPSALATLRKLRTCAQSWEPGARLIGNVTADEIVAACTAVLDGP